MIVGRNIAVAVLMLMAAATVTLGERPGGRDEGADRRVRWRTDEITISVSESLRKPSAGIKFGSEVSGALRRSLSAWSSVSGFDLREVRSAKQSVSASGIRGDGVNLITIAATPENVALFPRGSADAAASTRVFFNGQRAIVEADIVLNPFQSFSTDGTYGTFDLESVLTHEIGHLLGLTHSTIFGSTMYERHSKNVSIGGFPFRSLSASDISSLRELYPESVGEGCCRQINGVVTARNGGFRSWQVWGEEAATGRVISESSAAADGRFQLSTGAFDALKIYFQAESERSLSASGYRDFSPADDVNTDQKARLTSVSSALEIDLIGLNSQLSDVPVTLKRGTTQRVFLGGRGLGAPGTSVASTSPFITVVDGSTAPADFDYSRGVVSVLVRVDGDAPAGEYTLFAEVRGGHRRYLPGSLVIE